MGKAYFFVWKHGHVAEFIDLLLGKMLLRSVQAGERPDASLLRGWPGHLLGLGDRAGEFLVRFDVDLLHSCIDNVVADVLRNTHHSTVD